MAGSSQEFCFGRTGVLDADLTTQEVWRDTCHALQPP
jgi:hypothetical protein